MQAGVAFWEICNRVTKPWDQTKGTHSIYSVGAFASTPADRPSASQHQHSDVRRKRFALTPLAYSWSATCELQQEGCELQLQGRELHPQQGQIAGPGEQPPPIETG
jgi:hypothetical protein